MENQYHIDDKLHGFDKHFTCEICGNATYTGPRIFEKHFSEGRHSMGMQTLNIPNSKEYYGLTKISEVLALHKNYKRKKIKIRHGIKRKTKNLKIVRKCDE